MKHLAIIQTEFLKEARNWDELSLEEQKGYLSRHPQSKRKLTAKPETPSQVKKVKPVKQKLAQKILQQGRVISVQTSEGRKFFKLDDQGQLWTSKNATYGWQKREQTLPNELNELKNEGAQLQRYNKPLHPIYFKTTDIVNAWVATGRSLPTGAYYGSAQIFTREYVEKKLPAFTDIQLLPGGDFVVENGSRKNVRFTDPSGDPGPFEKQYAFDATLRELPLSVLVRTNEAGHPIEAPKKKKKLPFLKTEPERPEPTVTPKPVEKPKTNEWPEDQIKSSLKELKSIIHHSMSDDELSVNEWKGQTQSIGISLRDVGNWQSNPNDEDDDFPVWQSYDKYKRIFDDWLQKRSWFNPDTMESFIDTSEKAWVEFGVKRKNPQPQTITTQPQPKQPVTDPIETKPQRKKGVKSDRFFIGKNNLELQKIWNEKEKAANTRAKNEKSQGVTWSPTVNWHGFPKHMAYAKTKDGRIIHMTEAIKENIIKLSTETGKSAYMTREQFKQHSQKIEPYLESFRDHFKNTSYWHS